MKDIIEKEIKKYQKFLKNKYLISPKLTGNIRFSRETMSWIVPSFFYKDQLVECSCPSDVADEISGVSLIYHFNSKDSYNVKSINHVHSYEQLLNELMKDPINFSIPKEFEFEYSKQQINMLEKFRNKLCEDISEQPNNSIVTDFQ